MATWNQDKLRTFLKVFCVVIDCNEWRRSVYQNRARSSYSVSAIGCYTNYWGKKLAISFFKDPSSLVSVCNVSSANRSFLCCKLRIDWCPERSVSLEVSRYLSAYLFNSVLHNESYDCDRPTLIKSISAANGLLLN